MQQGRQVPKLIEARLRRQRTRVVVSTEHA
jgi:hypothetical protein